MEQLKKRILCFGDSNTWGYNSQDGSRFPEDVRWTGRLQQLLGDGYTVIEEGQNGRTTVWDDPIENRLAGITYLWPCMESQAPFDLMIVMLGTNDLKPYFGMEAGNIADAAGRLVRTAMESPFGPDKKSPQVLLVSPIHVEASRDYAYLYGDREAKKSRELGKFFSRCAEQLGCHYLDAAAIASPGVPDGVHLDPKGHGLLAQAMWEKVKEILG